MTPNHLTFVKGRAIADAQRLVSMRDLLDKFRLLNNSQRKERLKKMHDFLCSVSSKPFRTEGFNTLDVCKVAYDERRHSAILAWLLDAAASHRQGSVFFRAFLRSIDIPEAIANSRYRVKTEHSEHESRIDIAVYSDSNFLVYIENKILAGEGDRQIEREFRDLRRFAKRIRVAEKHQYPVFLTIDGKLPTRDYDSSWRTISYRDLARAFSEVLPVITNTKLHDFLKDWIELFKNGGHKMKWSEDMDIIIANWDACEEVHNAYHKLEQYVVRIMLSLKEQLERTSWWGPEWRFEQWSNEQVYIWNTQWCDSSENRLLNIGVQNFTAAALFGNDDPASFYVWVEKGKHVVELMNKLTPSVYRESDMLHSYTDNSLTRNIEKCYPEKNERYDELLEKRIREIVSFFGEYASDNHQQISKAVKEVLGNSIA